MKTTLTILLLSLSSTIFASSKCDVVPLKDHEIQKGEKYFVNSVANLRRRLGPQKFEMIGFVMQIKKLEKTFPIKDEYTIKDIAKGKLSSVFSDMPEQTFYQITDEFWVERDGLSRNMKGCNYSEILKAGQGVKFSIQNGVKLTNNNGEWIKEKAILYCSLAEADQVNCYANGKMTTLKLSEIQSKLKQVEEK
jgi:hypothetical protein